MRLHQCFLALAILWGPVVSLQAQQFAAPAAKPPAEAMLKAIKAKTEKLEKVIARLRKDKVRDPALADIEIYHKAATWIVRHNEFYQANYADWTLAVLDQGLLRASQAAQGEFPWLAGVGQTIVRGYRSRVDGSVQPFAVTFPAGYGENQRERWRIDVVLHGRDASLTEVKFLHQHGEAKPPAKEQRFIRIDIYGRGNIAYRWAGEADVFEALDNFYAVERLARRDQLLDSNRVVLRGFSMGGAGSWHLGLHYPDRWCVIGPGAGFTVTHGYVKGLPDKLPPYQQACLHIYDAADYAANAFNVPVVAYSGSDDPQLAAAVNIEKRLKPLGIPMTHLVAQGLGHSFPPEWQQKAEAEYARCAGPGRPDYPTKVRLVTYTARYSTCAWVEVLGLERHYQQSVVEGERTGKGFNLKSTNIRALRLGLPESVNQAARIGLAEGLAPQIIKIDNDELSVRPYRSGVGLGGIYLEKQAGRWQSVLPQRWYVDNIRRPRKTLGKQGPIDDAFMDSFVCVRGTGKAWHPAVQQYAEQNLERFRQEWDKFLRGELPIKDDLDITEDDLSSRHLVLFGDPAANSLLGQCLSGLPLRWTKESIVLGGKTFAGANHVPALIYPSPVNAARYVVLNSGHTFHAADFRGTNALLYPRLGDYAILKLAPTEKDPLAVEVATAGLFDDDWQLPKE